LISGPAVKTQKAPAQSYRDSGFARKTNDLGPPAIRDWPGCIRRFPKSLSAGMENIASAVEFSLAGFQDGKILRQWIESPAVPIVHTLIDRPAATHQCELKQDCTFFREFKPNASEIGVSSTRSGRRNRAPRTLVEGKQPCDEIRARFNL